jgi:biotin carboxyl carrier protein
VRLIAQHGDGAEIPVEVERAGSGYRVKIGERWLVADMVNAGPFVRSLRLEDGTQLALIHHREGNTHEITFADSTIHLEITDPLSLKRKRGDDEMGGAGMVNALMPGRIVRIAVSKGQQVRKGESLLVLEAMKMENDIQAAADGTIDEIFVEAGQTVEGGAELIHITPL